MADKPTYDELTEFGQCIINDHVGEAIPALEQAFGKDAPNKSGMIDNVLRTVGIRAALTQDHIEECEHLKPSDSPEVTRDDVILGKSI